MGRPSCWMRNWTNSLPFLIRARCLQQPVNWSSHHRVKVAALKNPGPKSLLLHCRKQMVSGSGLGGYFYPAAEIQVQLMKPVSESAVAGSSVQAAVRRRELCWRRTQVFFLMLWLRLFAWSWVLPHAILVLLLQQKSETTLEESQWVNFL